MNEKYLTKQKVTEIINGAPEGTDAKDIINGLVSRGYTLEGYTPDKASPQERAPKITAVDTGAVGEQVEQPKAEPKKSTIPLSSGGLLGVGPFSVGAEALGEVSTGVAKGIGSTLFGVAGLGAKTINALGQLTGIDARVPVPEQPAALEAKNVYQSIGKGAEQIAEFFIPMGVEAKIAGSFDKLVDTARFAEKFGPKAGAALTGILKVMERAGMGAASTAAVTAAQTAGDVEATKTAAKLGAVGGAIGGALEVFGPKLSKSLQESSLNLTETQKQKYSKKLNGAVDYISENIGVGTPTTRFNKAVKQVAEKENQLQTFLTTAAKDRTVPKQTIIDKLDELKGAFSEERDALAIEKQIDGMIDTLKKKWANDIPVEKLNKLKRSTYESAYSKAGEKVLDYVEAAMGNVLKTSIEGATQGLTLGKQSIEAFNKEYGNLLNAKALLNIARKKGGLGLSGKAILLLLGAELGGIGGELAGLAIGGTRAPGTLLKTAGSTLAKQGAMPAKVLTSTAAQQFISQPTQEAQRQSSAPQQ